MRTKLAIAAIGVRAAADGKAWVVQQPGAFRLFHRNGSQELVIRPGRLQKCPGYGNTQHVDVGAVK